MITPEIISLIQSLIGALLAGGLVGGVVSIILGRHKPPLDKQAANDATRKSYAETFASEIGTMKQIIDELRRERNEDQEIVKRKMESYDEQLKLLTRRADEADAIATAWKERTLIAVRHFDILEDHIIKKLPPPPPPRPMLY